MHYRYRTPAAGIAFAAVLAACGGGQGGMQATPVTMPQATSSMALTPAGTTMSFEDLGFDAVLPPKTIGEELPSEGLGNINDEKWESVVGGFTQTRYSQTLAFPPGTRITIHNLSKSLPHTLNVVKAIDGPPARFPASPVLSTSAHGTRLEAGYRSGAIMPGKAVTVTLVKGRYLIGCAFHYVSNQMRTVIVVEDGAKPGPQATPPGAKSTSSPSPNPTYSGWTP